MVQGGSTWFLIRNTLLLLMIFFEGFEERYNKSFFYQTFLLKVTDTINNKNWMTKKVYLPKSKMVGIKSLPYYPWIPWSNKKLHDENHCVIYLV